MESFYSKALPDYLPFVYYHRYTDFMNTSSHDATHQMTPEEQERARKEFVDWLNPDTTEIAAIHIVSEMGETLIITENEIIKKCVLSFYEKLKSLHIELEGFDPFASWERQSLYDYYPPFLHFAQEVIEKVRLKGVTVEGQAPPDVQNQLNQPKQ